MIFGSVRNLVLPISGHEFLIAEINHLVNKRPIAFAAALRDDSLETLPAAITPEILLHGRELVSVKVIPQYEVEEEIGESLEIFN